MKNSLIPRIIIVGFIIFFGLKSLSEILEPGGKNGNATGDTGALRLSEKLFPFSSRTNVLIGNALLERFIKSNNEDQLNESIVRLRKAVRLNRLNFQAHLSMAKAYMSFETGDPIIFENGLNALKAASNIRPTNLKINFETLKIFVSLWPFLDSQDKSWAGELLGNMIQRLNGDQFREILQIWGLYSKDPGFIKFAGNDPGRFYKDIVDELEKQELSLNLRQTLLANLENLSLTDISNKFSESQSRMKIPFSTYDRINGISFYHKLAGKVKFSENTYHSLKKEINLYIIKELVKPENRGRTDDLFKYIDHYLNDFTLIRDIEELEVILNGVNYFQSNDLKVFYLQQKINFATGQMSRLISETESFRRTLTFVKEGQQADVARLYTLLTDAYISSRLLTKAQEILGEIDKISPELLSTYWRLLRIENIIGEDESFMNEKMDIFNRIRDSNKIVMDRSPLVSTVYPYKVDTLSVGADENYLEKFRSAHLLQIFLNGEIFHESYIAGLTLPVELALPEDYQNMSFQLMVRVK